MKEMTANHFRGYLKAVVDEAVKDAKRLRAAGLKHRGK